MDCIKNNIEITKRQNNFICTFKMAYNNTCNSINTGYSPFFVRFKKESKIIKYTYTKQHKHSNPVPVLLYNYYFLYKVIYNPTILFIPTNPNSDYALMYGGLASTITGGNFLEGAEIGLDVTALNHALHAALDPDPTQQQKQKSKLVLQYEKENGVELYSTMDEAAIDWGKNNNFKSILNNTEYNSNIFEVNIDNNSWYGYTSPKAGTASTSSPFPIPKGTSLVGRIHSHAAYDNNYNNNIFSGSDKKNAEVFGFKAYIVTPNGSFQSYNPNNLFHNKGFYFDYRDSSINKLAPQPKLSQITLFKYFY